MVHTTLISARELGPHLGDPDWVVVDCRFQLKDPGHGRRAYGQAHIAGAVFADLNEDLSGPIAAGRTPRHPLPAVEAFARRCSAWGIGGRSQVVAYDELGGALAAARLWWMLRWLGHERAAVLDGGWQEWERAGGPVRGGVEGREPRLFEPRPRPGMLLTAREVLASLGGRSLRLLDARSADRYRGENETIDPVAGHIPGAVSAPYAGNLEAGGLFKPAGELRARYLALLGGLPAEKAALYCGSGVTAPHGILALAAAGLGEARLYAGSWSEWILDPGRPVATGSG